MYKNIYISIIITVYVYATSDSIYQSIDSSFIFSLKKFSKTDSHTCTE